METIILAGGMGKRLRDVVKDTPKPMAIVSGRPFLSYLLDYLKENGVTKAILSVGYKRHVIEEYFGSDYKGLKIQYVTEDEPLGTGGALRKSLEAASGEHVLVMNGDTFFRVHLGELLRVHLDSKASITLALKPMRNFDRYGTVLTKGNRVVGFEEKSYKDFGHINGGVFLVNRATLLDAFKRLGEKFSFEIDFLQDSVGSLEVYAYVSDTYFIDIGVPEDYSRAQEDFRDLP